MLTVPHRVMCLNYRSPASGTISGSGETWEVGPKWRKKAAGGQTLRFRLPFCSGEDDGMWSPSWTLLQPGSPLLPCLALCVELYLQSEPKRTLSPLGWLFGHSAQEGTTGHGCPCRVCLGCPSSSRIELRLFQEQDHGLSESIIVLGLLAFLHPSIPRNVQI